MRTVQDLGQTTWLSLKKVSRKVIKFQRLVSSYFMCRRNFCESYGSGNVRCLSSGKTGDENSLGRHQLNLLPTFSMVVVLSTYTRLACVQCLASPAAHWLNLQSSCSLITQIFNSSPMASYPTPSSSPVTWFVALACKPWHLHFLCCGRPLRLFSGHRSATRSLLAASSDGSGGRLQQQ